MPPELRKVMNRGNRASSMQYIDSQGHTFYKDGEESETKAMTEWEIMVQAAKAGIPYEQYKHQRDEQAAGAAAAAQDKHEVGPIDPKSISALKTTLEEQTAKAKELADQVKKQRV